MELTRLEKIKKLNEACEILKKEFVGLDKIIDDIKTAVLPWYITPEVIERPTVISLWGMTGTGKTSVIRRLIDLLSLKSQALFFDCGEKNSDEDTIIDEIKREVNREDYSVDKANFVFVFDEFQYARTIDENGDEVDKPTLRPIWNLLDNGILYIPRYSRYELDYFNGYVEDLTLLAEEAPDMKLTNGTVSDSKDVEKVLSAMGFFYFGRGVPGVVDIDPYDEFGCAEDETGKDPYRPLKLLEDRIIRTVYRKSSTTKGSEFPSIQDLLGCTTLSELTGLLNKCKSLVNVPVSVDCSGSLVFIVGNLDEAFTSSSELTPDIDADIFYEETSKITTTDIKSALKLRFRPEQIARFGNSLIKYPSLTKQSFREVIEKEVGRVCSKFMESEPGIKVKVDESIYNLLYSEGVYPTQGVRPVFTTVNTIFTPILSKALIKLGDEKGEVEIKVLDEKEGYKRDFATIGLIYNDGSEIETIKVELTLGQSRNPENRKTAYICSVHEIGHAIVYSYLTGKLPTSIVSVSTDNGGFCTTFDKDKFREIRSKEDIDNDVMISVAGYEAEQFIFGDKPKKTLLGSSSDIIGSWDNFSDAAYACGYFEPYLYTNFNTGRNSGGPASGFNDEEIQKKSKAVFHELRMETKKILKENKELLIQSALVLGEKGEISGHEFEELIKKYGKSLTTEKMKTMQEENSYEWYKNILINEKQE